MADKKEREVDPDPEGWRLDVLPIEPPRLLGGDRTLVIVGAMLSGSFTFALGAMALGGPYFVPIVVFGIVLWLGWVAAARRAWEIDPMLIRTWLRFQRYPHFIAAHSTGAVPDSKRKALRAREGFRR